MRLGRAQDFLCPVTNQPLSMVKKRKLSELKGQFQELGWQLRHPCSDSSLASQQRLPVRLSKERRAAVLWCGLLLQVRKPTPGWASKSRYRQALESCISYLEGGHRYPAASACRSPTRSLEKQMQLQDISVARECQWRHLSNSYTPGYFFVMFRHSKPPGSPQKPKLLQGEPLLPLVMLQNHCAKSTTAEPNNSLLPPSLLKAKAENPCEGSLPLADKISPESSTQRRKWLFSQE